MIKIESKEIVTVRVIEYVEILSGNIYMKDRYAVFPVRLFDQNGNILGTENIEIFEEEYDAWSSDDYIEEITLSRLGLVKSVEPEPIVPVEPEPIVPVEPEPIVPVEPEPISGAAGVPISGTSSENI
jgi:hypothetical protein